VSEIDATIIELSRPGVIWLGAEAVPIEFTGAGRAVAGLVEASDDDSRVQDVVRPVWPDELPAR
jgi:hypothetical protein